MESTRSANTTLRRRNSIGTSVVGPTKLSLPTKPYHTSSFFTGSASADDFELISFKPTSYTSLKDILPSSTAAAMSPRPATPGGAASGYEISIRNRLVKQAAWAYLQPMSTSQDSSGRHFLHPMWVRISGEYIRNSVTSLIRRITRAFDRMLRAIWVRNSR